MNDESKNILRIFIGTTLAFLIFILGIIYVIIKTNYAMIMIIVGILFIMMLSIIWLIIYDLYKKEK